MAKMIIKHYSQTRVGSSGQGRLQFVEPDAVAVRQVKPFSGAAVQSAAFKYERIQVQSDTDFLVAFGSEPTAVTPDFNYPTVQVFTLAVCIDHKISVRTV